MQKKDSNPQRVTAELKCKEDEIKGSLWLAFVKTVRQFPKAEAVRYRNSSLSYEELYRLSLRIKQYLSEAGISKNARVGIKMPKGIHLLAHILACWAGHTSVLLLEEDTAFDELTRKLTKSQIISLVVENTSDITSSEVNIIRASPPQFEATGVDINVFQDKKLCEAQSINAIASILFTSGTTGISKCVALEHKGLLTIIQGLIGHYRLTTTSRLAWTASLSFDSAIAEPLLTLISGASLVIPDQSQLLVGATLEDFLIKEKITHLIITPSILETADPTNIPTKITIVLVGEPLSDKTVERWSKDRVLYNAYGPSEASICATVSERIKPNKRVAVGRPLPGVRIEIINEDRKILPSGVLGEVAIGGVGVSSGYLNDAVANSSAFIHLQPSDELFHLTGDIGFIGDKGELVLRGRKDQQVKINGRRVDLSEVERALCKQNSVLQACAMKADMEGSKHRLVVFMRLDLSQKEPTVQELREHMAMLLPSFAIPSAWYVVNSIPTTLNGKLNRKMLFESVSYELPRGNYVPPNDGIEKEISNIFENLLGIENIGRHDNLFFLGSSSLDTIRLIEHLRRNFDINIDYESFIRKPTVYDVTSLIHNGRISNKVTEPPLPIDILPKAYQRVELTSHYPESVFISGATGFLGKCILAELLIRTQAQIICATRHSSHHQLVAALMEYSGLAQHWNSEWNRRVSSTYFDLEETQDPQLATAIKDVDLIIHCAANVNLAYDFGSLYKANVLSTLNLVNFSSVGCPKRLVLISSRSAVDSKDTSGYGRTKLEAERIAQAAFTRGLGGSIIRPGRITGHTSFKYINNNDFIIRSIRACLLLGLYPQELEVFGGSPVNVLAQNIVMASMQTDTENHLINISDSDIYYFNEIFHLTSIAGFPVQPVQINEWLSNARCHPNDIMAQFPDVLAGFEKNWSEIQQSYSVKNYGSVENQSSKRAEITSHLVTSLLSSLI